MQKPPKYPCPPLFRAFKGAILTAITITTCSLQAAVVFLEQGGRVTIEAEHPDSRVADDPVGTAPHRWQIVPDENSQGAPAVTFTGARAGKYITVLPDSTGGGQNQNQAGDEDLLPSVDYKVRITTPGDYRLWLRWGGYDGSSDSMYAQIVEAAAPGHYRYVFNSGGRFGAWNGIAAPDSNSGGGDEVPAVYAGLAAGLYTIRITQREDGAAVDTITLQLNSLPDPVGIGPAESATEGNVIPIPALVISKQPADALGAVGGSASFSLDLNVVPQTIKWFKNGTEIAGATGFAYTTPVLTTVDTGAKFKAVASNTSGSVETREALLTVVPVLEVAGAALAELYRGIGGTTVGDLTNSPAYPGGPSDTALVKFLEYPPGGDDGTAPAADIFSDYGTRITGYITPKETANYVFYLAADDGANFWLSTDSSPANARLKAWEPTWNPVRDFSGAARRPGCDAGDCENISDPIRLTAGQKYFFEALAKEGGGGDNLAVAWTKEGEAPPDTTSLPIGAEFLSYTVPQIISLGTVNSGFKTIKFSVKDVGTSILDPASVRVTFDGQPVTPTAAAKTAEGVTAFTYTHPAALQTGSTHNYSVEVRDTTGKAVSTGITSFTLATPFFPPADLRGPAIVDKMWAVRFISGVTDAAGNTVQMTGLPNIFSQIASAPAANIADTTSEVVNWPSGGFMPDDIPYPDAAMAGGTCCTDDFVNLNVGHIVIPEEGHYTFGVHSDDGFGLRIRGGEAISINGAGRIDLAAPEGVVHPADTGDSNTRAVYHLQKGVYRIEFFWWERAGGDFAELYAAKGGFATDASTDTWLLVGANVPGALKLTSAPTGIEGGGPGPTITVTRTANALTIAWVPTGGTLETSAELGAAASWIAVGTANPATVQIGSATRAAFYRVRR